MRDSRDDEFEAYVQARSSVLLRTAYLIVGNQSDAEDLLQTALAKAYLAWDRIRDRGAVDAYVRRILVNTHTSWWRRRRVDEYPTDTLPELQHAPDRAAERVLHLAMWQALAQLPTRQRAMVVLRYYEDLTEVETADLLGVAVGTVKSTVARALAKLRENAELRAEMGRDEAALPRQGEPVEPVASDSRP